MITLITHTSMMRSLLLLTVLTLLSACKSTTENTEEYSYYGNYYLWIKGLNTHELLKEIELQKLKESQGNQDAEYYLLLLNSLPNSPIHNPYIAKSRLNQQALTQEAYTRFNVGNLAFIIMLRDQLNQQLLILNKLIDKEKTQKENQKQLNEQLQSIEKLEQNSQKLQQQIIQLKKIESSINEHGKSL